jgi:hypothetical protein
VVLRDSPSLRRSIDSAIVEQLGLAAQLAEDDLADCAEPSEKIRARIGAGGFTALQVLGDWFPDPPG